MLKGFYWFKMHSVSIFLLLLCAIYFVMLSFSLDWIYREGFYYIINSDQVSYESLYKDFFTRFYLINGWQVPRAPFFFPDCILYFIIRMFVGSYGAAWYTYLVFNFGFILLFFYGIVRLFHKTSKSKDLLYSICWSTILIVFLKFETKGYGPHTFLLLGYHSGALLNGLFILWIWNRSLITSLKYNQLFIFMLFCAIATMSDLWWIVWFGIPIGLATLILILVKKLAWRNNIIFLTVMGLGAITGELANRLIDIKKWLYYPNAPVGTASSSFLDQLHLLYRDLFDLFAGSPILLGLFVLCIGICVLVITSWSYTKKWGKIALPLRLPQNKTTSFVALHLAVIFSFIVPLCCIVVFKLWQLWNYRYIYPIIFLPWVMVGLFLSPMRSAHNIKYFAILYLSPLVLFLPLLFGGNASSFGSSRQGVSWETETPYHQWIACADAVARSHHLKFGASEYWSAKSISETNHSGLFVNQFTYNFDVLHWINNFHWYFDPANKNEPLRYDFIISSRGESSWAKAQTLFGRPTEINTCNGHEILIYTGEKKKHLNEILKLQVARFFDQISEAPILGQNILHNGNFESSSTNNWLYRAEPGISTFQRMLFDKEVNPTGGNTKYYSRWEVKNPASFAFLEQRFDNINTLAGKDLTLIFWARSLSGKIKIYSHGYLVPRGVLDNTAIFFNSGQNSLFELNDKWQKIKIFFPAPTIFGLNMTSNSYALIRPLFFENSTRPLTIDIADIQLLSRGDTIAVAKNNGDYQPAVVSQDVLNLIASADSMHSKGKFSEEFKFLKRAEMTTSTNIAILQQFMDANSKIISQKNIPTPFIHAEILWRLARAHYNFSKGVPSNERKGNIYVAADYASSAYKLTANSNTRKWLAITTAEMGGIEGVRQKNIAAAMFSDLIQKAISADPSNAELYALMGYWHYRLADKGYFSKVRSKLLFSPMPNGSFLTAKQYFLRAVSLAPNNVPYRLWLAKTYIKLKANLAAAEQLKIATKIKPRSNFLDPKIMETQTQTFPVST